MVGRCVGFGRRSMRHNLHGFQEERVNLSLSGVPYAVTSATAGATSITCPGNGLPPSSGCPA
jgi:hypothetical protein